MKNATIFIMKNDEAPITITNATQLSIGFRLIYVEYQEDGEERIRAFGRNEFDAVEIDDAEDVKAIIPLNDGAFRKVEAHFEYEMPDDEDDTDPEEPGESEE